MGFKVIDEIDGGEASKQDRIIRPGDFMTMIDNRLINTLDEVSCVESGADRDITFSGHSQGIPAEVSQSSGHTIVTTPAIENVKPL
jgi:hypothetical protein